MKPVSSRFLRGALAACAATTGIASVTGAAEAQTYRNELPTYQNREYSALGVVDSIETVQGTNKGNRVAGAILGGVIGGILGHQIGSGRGNDAATVVGALGGAAVGHEIGESKGTLDAHRVSVRMDDGGVRVVEQISLNGLRIGDRVRIDGDRVALYAGDRDRNDSQGAQGYYAPPPADSYPDQSSQVRQDERVRYDRDGNRIDDRPSYRNEDRTRPDSLYRTESETRYDAQNYRVDAQGYRIDAQGYRLDDRGNRF